VTIPSAAFRGAGFAAGDLVRVEAEGKVGSSGVPNLSLKISDALILATADLREADTVITGDRRWPDQRARRAAHARP
jgi:predicted nucleic acid-binding protein